jgi:hypothetical protein
MVSSNLLRIEGRESIIVNTQMQPQIGLFVYSEYQGKQYPLKSILALDEDIALAILRFDREDRKIVAGDLNHILVMTSVGNGIYRALGVERLPEKEVARKVVWHRIGEPKILVAASAEEALSSIKKYKQDLRELMEQARNYGGLAGQFGLQN